MTDYLNLEDVLRQVERMGFVGRDEGLLASALARPQASAFGTDAYPDLFTKAAALCQSLDHNQSLVDGNKRTGWLATKVFLRLNGRRLTASADAGERFMLDLVAGHQELDLISDWLSGHCVAVDPTDIG
ncbi:MAG: type II toxin-antitoxin system death-on-curing family toxin [Jatrophihabitans sp.]